ncbi:MAG: cupredoxin domain-containing protein [Anaerolineales bacterium]|nr:cupredoxin domain-containing protein [Anaerolineales bacterium]
MNSKRLLIGGLLFLALLLSACGGNGNGASTNITLKMTDFSFTPNTFTVPAGKEITVQVSNEGVVEHEFVIMKFGAEVTSPFDDDDEANIYWEIELEPGESETVTFTAPSEAGKYQISCGTPGHHEAGMTGTLTVVK